MGYYTYYQLRMWDEEGKELKPAVAAFIKAKLAEIAELEVSDVNYMHDFGEELKWYDHDENMHELAAQYPHVKFELEGKGEDVDDWWVAQYWGDKFERAFVQPPEPKMFAPVEKPKTEYIWLFEDCNSNYRAFHNIEDAYEFAKKKIVKWGDKVDVDKCLKELEENYPNKYSGFWVDDLLWCYQIECN